MAIRKASDQFFAVFLVAIFALTFGYLFGVKSAEIIAEQGDRIEQELIR